MKKVYITVVVCLIFITGGIFAQEIGQEIANLRSGVALTEQEKTNTIPRPIVDDKKISRNYPMQPPIIPHNIRDYQLNKNVNTCLVCHSRSQVTETQATMVSVTHYMDRDGNFLANISPRRYFCTQCHVTQSDTKPLVKNEFTDMNILISKKLREQESEKDE
jgi:cytochrome c-type protein NapB